MHVSLRRCEEVLKDCEIMKNLKQCRMRNARYARPMLKLQHMLCMVKAYWRGLLRKDADYWDHNEPEDHRWQYLVVYQQEHERIARCRCINAWRWRIMSSMKELLALMRLSKRIGVQSLLMNAMSDIQEVEITKREREGCWWFQTWNMKWSMMRTILWSKKRLWGTRMAEMPYQMSNLAEMQGDNKIWSFMPWRHQEEVKGWCQTIECAIQCANTYSWWRMGQRRSLKGVMSPSWPRASKHAIWRSCRHQNDTIMMNEDGNASHKSAAHDGMI